MLRRIYFFFCMLIAVGLTAMGQSYQSVAHQGNAEDTTPVNSIVGVQKTLFFMERITGKSIPIPSEADTEIPSTGEEGIYSAVINITKGMTFGFYTGQLGAPDIIYQSVQNSNLNFYGQESPSWPVGGNENRAGGIREKGPNEIGTWWCVISFSDPQEKIVPVRVTVNLNTMRILLEQQEINEELPECLYIWGSPDGRDRFQCVACLLPSPTTPEVYEAEYDMPEVKEFFDSVDDGAGSGTVGDETVFPDHGFRFNISTDGLSVTGGKKFYAPLSNFLIDLAEDSEPFTTIMTPIQGSVFYGLTPGPVCIAVNYSSKEIFVSPLESPEDLLYIP